MYLNTEGHISTMDIYHDVKLIPTEKLKPYGNNPKKHPQEQIDKLKKSIKEFGFTVPLIIGKDLEVVAGHGRLIASKQLGIEELPCIERTDLTEEQMKAFRIADNKLTESEWDEEALNLELTELNDLDIDLELTGFEGEELTELGLEGGVDETDSIDHYTDKIETPTYEPTQEEPPELDELYKDKKFKELIEKIEESDIEGDLKKFLKLTAYRHIIFNYENIAEYYAHAPTEVQDLMEELTLVIIDFDQAVEQGYVDFVKETLEGVE